MKNKTLTLGLSLAFVAFFVVSCAGPDQESIDKISQLEKTNGELQLQVTSLNQQIVDLQTTVTEKDAKIDLISQDFTVERACLIEKYTSFGNRFNGAYGLGKIIVQFVEGTTEIEAKSVATEFGLTWGDRRWNDDFRWADFVVPEGEEIGWICKVGFHEKVKSAEPNLIGTTT